MKTHASHAVVTKLPTGIGGFDEITDGGIPRHRTTLVTGGPGSGKTVFALQSLVYGAGIKSEAGMFVAFEESTGQIMANAATFGWDIKALCRKKKLFFLDARLAPEVIRAGEFDLTGMLSILEAKACEIGAKQIVFDGIDVLLSLLDDPVLERRELYRIRDWLTRTGLTGIITQKAGADLDLEVAELNVDTQRYNHLQFMVDCVVILRHKVLNGSAFRTLRVMKYRGSGCPGDEFPIIVGGKGIRLTHRGPNELRYSVSDERVSTGLDRLDFMLSGGYHRGSNVLISGAPGSAKSTLAGLFAEAACKRGERTLYVSFDEGADQIVRNLKSVGVNLAPHLKSGLLQMYSTRTRGPNIEVQFGELRARVLAHDPRCLVVDPLSALSTRQSILPSVDVSQQFIDFLKTEGITVVNTSLMDAAIGTDETTATGISTIADTWIHLSYVVQDGERNRALTIVKSRGTGHSNQVRELTLSDNGVTLTDVFVAQGKVLMGVARWEWEQEAQAAKLRAEAATERKRLDLRLSQAEAVARLEVIRTEIEVRAAEINLLAVETGSASRLVATGKATMRKLRHADDKVALTSKSVIPPRKRRAAKGGKGKAQ